MSDQITTSHSDSCMRGQKVGSVRADLVTSKKKRPYGKLKFHFQKLSEIEIFRKSKDFGLVLIWIITTCLWCYIWCCKQHSIIVAGFQQKCCSSAPNVNFSIFAWIKQYLHEKSTFIAEKQHFSWKPATMMLCCLQQQI